MLTKGLEVIERAKWRTASVGYPMRDVAEYLVPEPIKQACEGTDGPVFAWFDTYLLTHRASPTPPTEHDGAIVFYAR